MTDRSHGRIHPAWWTAILLVFLMAVVAMTAGFFSGTFRSSVPVTVTSDRSGLVMEVGSKVKLRGLQVGRVAGIVGGDNPVSLKLELNPDDLKYIPANIEARIRATTVFGAKYVDLVYPDDPAAQRLTAGAVIESQNVTNEVNTVFENLVSVLHKVNPDKLNGILSALAEGFRGQGSRIGDAITDANQVLLVVNPKADAVRADWQSLKGFSDTYTGAARDITTALDAASTVSTAITDNAQALDSLLLSVIGFSNSGINVLGPTKDNFVTAVKVLEPTTNLLLKYNPIVTCTILSAEWNQEHGGREGLGGNGRSAILDANLAWGNDPYVFPDNLPIVGAKGGPGGKPSCGSMPDPTKLYPIRQLVMNTGWGTGNDVRVNPGIGFPGWVDFFPVTRGVPKPPSMRYQGGPAPGPIPYPGAPPWGAPLYAPDGTPLFPGLPAAPPPGAPRDPGATPGSEPFVTPYPAQVQPTPLPTPSPPPPVPPPVPADSTSQEGR
ncbi:Virulence factor Mce family protein [uncultured Mycobacterium sp.]|uniref:Virulence factor Mce family protein n=1 Tax=uncultured Mycobacterium sp. TaxID=171292 RepID=A0A1Y5PK60_9MYCO|nr:Virulence factor Mce family protein [uncultured Mycobacterium sp.]